MISQFPWKTIKEYQEILFQQYKGIAKISINRPHKHNAFTPLTAACVIPTGCGLMRCAGAAWAAPGCCAGLAGTLPPPPDIRSRVRTVRCRRSRDRRRRCA